MKKIPAGEFKARCLTLMEDVRSTRETRSVGILVILLDSHGMVWAVADSKHAGRKNSAQPAAEDGVVKTRNVGLPARNPCSAQDDKI